MNPELAVVDDGDLLARARPVYRVREKSSDLDHVPAALQALANLNNFAGEVGAVLNAPEGALVGIGAGADPLAIAAAGERLTAGDYKLVEPADFAAGVAVAGRDEAQLSIFAWLLGGYRFDRYKSEKGALARLVVPSARGLEAARRDAAAVTLVRDLVNTPACDLGPDELERVARQIAERFDAAISVVAGDDLLAMNLPMIHAVGRASNRMPRLIDVTWGDPAAPRVTIVGKGVCFDSGGLNIKNDGGMALMKKDMGGAAHALALAQLVMGAALPVRLRVLIPAVENAISGSAFRPGDILLSRKGLTVEIGNTDAEGRLVLADAMALGAEDEPQLMVTLATLTGAARVALGPELPPFYCTDEGFAGELLSSAERTADPVWRMPLWRPYEAMLSSPIADLTNAPAGGFAGSVTAALFLKRFAPPQAIFAHFDIYAWRARAAPGRPVGGEAQAIRALFDVLARGIVR